MKLKNLIPLQDTQDKKDEDRTRTRASQPGE